MDNLNIKIMSTAYHKIKEFLLNRFADKKRYRGINISTQNRYDLHIIRALLKNLHEYDNKYLEVLVGDDHGENTKNLHDFNNYCTKIKKEIGHGTMNSIKKNYFTDLYRMGLIDRYDQNRNKILSNYRSTYKYVKISEDGKRLLDANEKVEQLIYCKSIEKLFPNNFLEILKKIIADFTIDKYNMAFFITGINQTFLENKYSYKDIKFLLNEWSKIDENSKRKIIKEIKKICTNQLAKSSFHNLLNQSEQILHLLSQLPWFKKNADVNKTIINIKSPILHAWLEEIPTALSYKKIEKLIKKRSIEIIEIRRKLRVNIIKNIILNKRYWSDFKNVDNRHIDDLEACHIKEVRTLKKQDNIINDEYFNFNNGLMMNRDAHYLFDKGIFTFNFNDGKILFNDNSIENKKRVAIAFKVDVDKVNSIQIKRLTKEMSSFLKQRKNEYPD